MQCWGFVKSKISTILLTVLLTLPVFDGLASNRPLLLEDQRCLTLTQPPSLHLVKIPYYRESMVLWRSFTGLVKWVAVLFQLHTVLILRTIHSNCERLPFHEKNAFRRLNEWPSFQKCQTPTPLSGLSITFSTFKKHHNHYAGVFCHTNVRAVVWVVHQHRVEKSAWVSLQKTFSVTSSFSSFITYFNILST